MMRISFSDSHFVLDLVKDDCRCCEFSLPLTLVSNKKCLVELQVGRSVALHIELMIHSTSLTCNTMCT